MSTFPAAAIKSDDISPALRALLDQYTSNSTKENSVDRIKKLRALHESYQVKHDFKPGDIVRWKSGLKNRKNPEYNEPAIVVSLLDETVHDLTEDSGSTYFRERLDIVIAIPKGTEVGFPMFHFDSRRFEIWTE